jgi:hypothetical protein
MPVVATERRRVVFTPADGQHAHMLWLQLVGLIAFALLLGCAFVVWRRRPAGQRNRELAVVPVAGTGAFGIGALALAATGA